MLMSELEIKTRDNLREMANACCDSSPRKSFSDRDIQVCAIVGVNWNYTKFCKTLRVHYLPIIGLFEDNKGVKSYKVEVSFEALPYALMCILQEKSSTWNSYAWHIYNNVVFDLVYQNPHFKNFWDKNIAESKSFSWLSIHEQSKLFLHWADSTTKDKVLALRKELFELEKQVIKQGKEALDASGYDWWKSSSSRIETKGMAAEALYSDGTTVKLFDGTEIMQYEGFRQHIEEDNR